jgi:hypothetical protein
MTPDPFEAVGNFFMDFTQVEDRDVVKYLHLAAEAMLARTPPSPASYDVRSIQEGAPYHAAHSRSPSEFGANVLR